MLETECVGTPDLACLRVLPADNAGDHTVVVAHGGVVPTAYPGCSRAGPSKKQSETFTPLDMRLFWAQRVLHRVNPSWFRPVQGEK